MADKNELTGDHLPDWATPPEDGVRRIVIESDPVTKQAKLFASGYGSIEEIVDSMLNAGYALLNANRPQ